MEFNGVTYQGTEITDRKTLEKLPLDLANFYSQVNGLIAFNGGLHLRGCVDFPEWHSINYYWTGTGALHNFYEQLNDCDIPFGQDCLGDQFILRDSVIHKLSGETGELENLELDFNEFLIRTIEDPMNFLLLQPLEQFISEGGQLSPGELLNVFPPFCLDNESNEYSFKNISVKDRIGFLTEFYEQTKNLKDGQQIKIRTK